MFTFFVTYVITMMLSLPVKSTVKLLGIPQINKFQKYFCRSPCASPKCIFYMKMYWLVPLQAEWKPASLKKLEINTV